MGQRGCSPVHSRKASDRKMRTPRGEPSRSTESHDVVCDTYTMSESTPPRLEAGQPAPEFTLRDESGTEVSLSDFRGSRVVLYTYPKAFTPGCTTEACDFRDADERITAAGYTVLAVSSDPVEKLASFKADYDLPFTLLSDPDHKVQTAYGAYGEKNNYGRKVTGAIRSTFIIDENGTLLDAKYNVRATGHVDRILSTLTES